MKAEITRALEYGTEKPCEIGRLTYRLGATDYVALAFRYIAPYTSWRLTWLGIAGGDSCQLPDGILPNDEMKRALLEAL